MSAILCHLNLYSKVHILIMRILLAILDSDHGLNEVQKVQTCNVLHLLNDNFLSIDNKAFELLNKCLIK